VGDTCGADDSLSKKTEEREGESHPLEGVDGEPNKGSKVTGRPQRETELLFRKNAEGLFLPDHIHGKRVCKSEKKGREVRRMQFCPGQWLNKMAAWGRGELGLTVDKRGLRTQEGPTSSAPRTRGVLDAIAAKRGGGRASRLRSKPM